MKFAVTLFVILLATCLTSCEKDNNPVSTSTTDNSLLIGYWFTKDYKDPEVAALEKDPDYYECACMQFIDDHTVIIFDDIEKATRKNNPLKNGNYYWFDGRPGWMCYDYEYNGIYNNRKFTYSISGRKITISCGRELTIDGDGRLVLEDANQDWIKSPYTKADYTPKDNPEDIIDEELAQYVNANITIKKDDDIITANINSSLASQYPGKNIKYGMKTGLTTTWQPDYYVPDMVLSVVYDCIPNESYATESNQSFTVSTAYPKYLGTSVKEGDGESYWLDPEVGIEIVIADYNVMKSRKKAIQDGTADECDIEDYYNLLRNLDSYYDEKIYRYVQCVVRLFVEIDGKRHTVKIIKKDAEMPEWVNPFFTYS